NYRNEFGPQVNNLASIVRGFKSAVARRSKKESLEHRIWQARYYEHIIRNQPELERIRMYIRENPFQWELDEENEFKKSA
ncbi:MAG TPA: transposase, partial [Bacteroidia bacterium]|nr:transposase [Bacteroidia bacterium]